MGQLCRPKFKKGATVAPKWAPKLGKTKKRVHVRLCRVLGFRLFS